MESFTCPFCGASETMEGEDMGRFVTYWGDDSIQEHECPDCDKTYWVNEVVTRDYWFGKTLEDARGW